MDALHPHDPVFHLLDYPNVDDLKNYFVDAMSYCLKMAFHLKKYLMLNVLAGGHLKDALMRDETLSKVGVLKPFPYSIPSRATLNREGALS